MTSRASLAAPSRGQGRPHYVPAAGDGGWSAVFPSGKQVPIDPGRIRHYPGFGDAAPCTQPLYRAITGAVSASTVLDAGAGCGEGAALLQSHYGRVVAVERDENAVNFGRQFAPHVAWRVSDIERVTQSDRADLICLVDVLTQSANPLQTLRALGPQLAAGGCLFVAEARAVPSQQLRAPQRCGFSRSELSALLVRAGFRVERWLDGGAEFCSLLAVPDGSRASDDLVCAVPRITEEGALEDSQLRGQLESCARDGNSGVRAEASLLLAELDLEGGDWQRAIERLETLVADRSRDGRTWAALSRVARARGRVREAWHFAQQATTLDPGCYDANLALALSAQVLARPDAVAAWGYVARLAPAAAAPVARLARVAAEQGDYKTGIVAFERLLSYPNEPNPELNTTLGWMFTMDGQHDRAMHQAMQALLGDAGCESAAELLRAVAAAHPELLAEA